MRFKSLLYLCAAIAAQSTLARAEPARQVVPQGPISYSSNVTHFAVWLPGAIRYSGHNDMISVFSPDAAKAKTEKVTFWVTFGINLGQNPPDGPKIPIEKHLADLVEGYGFFSQSDSFHTQRIEQNGVAGYELSFIGNRGIKGNRLRIYETSQRLYQIHAAGSEAALEKNRALIDRVFDSFRILPQ